MLKDGVTREHVVGGEGGERDGVMDEGDETVSNSVVGAVVAVVAVGVVVWKVSVWGGIRELCFLYARNKNFFAVQQGPELTAAAAHPWLFMAGAPSGLVGGEIVLPQGFSSPPLPPQGLRLSEKNQV